MKSLLVLCASALVLLAACNRVPQPSTIPAAVTAQDKRVASIVTTRSDYAASLAVGQAIEMS